MQLLTRLLARPIAAALIVVVWLPSAASAQAPVGLYTQIYSFECTEDRNPVGRLLSLDDGRIIGTTFVGGAYDNGTVFELKSSTNSFHILHDFGKPGGEDGWDPAAGLVVGPDGNLWGTTSYAGSGNGGTIFRMLPDGHVQTIHNFVIFGPDGFEPRTTLTLASDGFLYGVTSGSNGTVFRIEADGSFATLWTMSGNDPDLLMSRLIEGSDGLLYGTSVFGSEEGDGTVFRLAKDGSGRQILHSFTGVDGCCLYSGVIEGSDGRIYGVTTQGGSTGTGTAFSMERDGSDFKTLHNFMPPAEGQFPNSELFETSRGVFVGTTLHGGPTGRGTVYQMLANGQLTILHVFQPPHRVNRGWVDGRYPTAQLAPAGDNTLLGITTTGGLERCGTIYRFRAR